MKSVKQNILSRKDWNCMLKRAAISSRFLWEKLVNPFGLLNERISQEALEKT
jgi:hypothetical protein